MSANDFTFARAFEDPTRLQTSADVLLDLLMETRISQEDYDRKRITLRERQKEVLMQIEAQGRGDDGFTDSMLWLLDLCRSAGTLYKGSTIEKKRALIAMLFENLSLKGETLCFSLKKTFCWVRDTTKTKKWSD